MKVWVTVFIFLVSAVGVDAQTSRPKSPPVKPKSTASKAQDDKKKAAAKKPDPKATAKKPAAAKTTAKAPPKKSTAAKTSTTKAPADKKTAVAKPKQNPVKPPPVDPEQLLADEKAEFEKAAAVEGADDRIAALKAFIKAYPESTFAAEARAMIVTIHTRVGNDSLTSADLAGALERYKAAIAAAPASMPDALFDQTLAKLPVNLFFRGAREESFEIAKLIERKVRQSVPQLIGVANFYMSVENGSEARRIANAAIKLDPTSSAAYQTLGLASRMDFKLEDSAAAYQKAVELDPESISARRGLAEMKRSLGKADEAVALYKDILAKTADEPGSQTGLVLALFEAGERTEAEAELAKQLETNPGNIMLQAGAAFWYAANGEGERAVQLGQTALAAEPRFIWSHIALARGYLAKRDPASAEKTLIAARRYGNFPTLEYELASARMASGFFREAAEELAKSFTVKNGIIYTKLGGRVERGSNDLSELIGYERRASIFAPSAPDEGESAAHLKALLDLKQELEKASPDRASVARATDAFVKGSDRMKIHRIVFAGNQLLDKKIALPKVVELAKEAPAVLDDGLLVPDPASAVMASELYAPRTIAASRGEHVNVPSVPRPTLSSVLRGRVEEMAGWAHFQMEAPDQASVHLKRAVSVLPVDSTYWRSSTWRLGSALALEGKTSDALDMYIRSYRSGQPDAFKYAIIEALYKRVNGHTMGLEQRVGPNPSPTAAEPVAQATPRPSVAVPMAQALPTPTPIEQIQTVSATADPTPEPRPVAETPPGQSSTPALEPDPTPAASPTPEATPESSPTPETTPAVSPTPEATPEPSPTPETTPAPTPEATPVPESSPAASNTPVETIIAKATPTPEPTASPAAARGTPPRRLDNSNGLFPPVVISIPTPQPTPSKGVSETTVARNEEKKDEAVEESSAPKPVPGADRVRIISGIPTKEETPCTLTLDQDTVSVQTSGAERAVVVRRTDDGDIDGVAASSMSPRDISIRREPLPGVKWTALFVIRSANGKPGLFQVRFDAPCGSKVVPVRVQ